MWGVQILLRNGCEEVDDAKSHVLVVVQGRNAWVKGTTCAEPIGISAVGKKLLR